MSIQTDDLHENDGSLRCRGGPCRTGHAHRGTPSGVYSPLFPGYLGSPQPFTQTSAPVRTGTGSVIDPWTVTSTFDATSSLHITQTVAHVDGTTEFLGTWAVHNTGGGSVNL